MPMLSVLAAANISAQTLRADLLDAQHIQRQQQQQQSLKSRLPSADVTPFIPTISPIDRTHYPAETPCFPITHVTLNGDSATRFAWALDAALAPRNTTGHLPSPIGQCLGAQGIELLASQVQNSIMAAGYITSRVMVEPQNIGAGHLALSLIPGRVHEIRFSGAAWMPTTMRRVQPLRSSITVRSLKLRAPRRFIPRN
ncbi:POTRA domain-containing protein [Advenella incenata]|nr:POTRA domain-containing protein [Advenella incenata]